MKLFRDLVAHYRKIELHEEDRKQLGDNDKAYSTKEGYTSLLENHILPQWGDWELGEISRVAFAVEVESWLKGLRRLDKKLMARGSKSKVRNIMSAVFAHAIRYRFMDRNPMEGVRQSAKRERVPSRLTEAELHALMQQLDLMYRVLLLYTGAIEEKTRRAQSQIVQQMLTGRSGRVLATQEAGNAYKNEHFSANCGA